MKLFIDSDILLDIILLRTPFDLPAAGVLSLADKKGFILCVSAHSLLNVFYITRKIAGKQAAVKPISLLEEKLQVIPTEGIVIRRAIQSGFSDLEDAVQHEMALMHKCQRIITRNLKDYKGSNLPVMTAEQLLAGMGI